jgi:hypothetical protein
MVVAALLVAMGSQLGHFPPARVRGLFHFHRIHLQARVLALAMRLRQGSIPQVLVLQVQVLPVQVLQRRLRSPQKVLP